jgi:uncharacterized caspase-like protein
MSARVDVECVSNTDYGEPLLGLLDEFADIVNEGEGKADIVVVEEHSGADAPPTTEQRDQSALARRPTRRVAFLIGNQTFLPNSGLLTLQGPANDVAALGCQLRHSERGKFEVREFLDKACHEILPEIERALGSASVGDLFLIYYSGHGKLAPNGGLCLATADTSQDAPRTTSIPTRYLRDLVEESACDQAVLLLDCCYSGAVDDGLRGDVASALHVIEDGRGLYIMTASTGIQAARETEPLPNGVVMGRFTAALVDGIKTGAADQRRRGEILLSDLHYYLRQTVTGSTPQFFSRKASGDPLISLSPATAAPLLDAEVLADLDSEQAHRRHGAVSALSKLLRDSDATTRAVVKAELQRRLGQEGDYNIRAQLESALTSEDVSAPGPRQLRPGRGHLPLLRGLLMRLTLSCRR